MSETTQKNRLLSISTPLGEDYLLLNRLSGTEGISTLFSYEVELLHDEGKIRGFDPTPVDPKVILGKSVLIEINQRRYRTKRPLTGIVSHFAQGHRDTRFSYYHATIVPQVWVLTQISQSRIFQHKSIPDILREVFTGLEVSYELQGNFKPRNYCAQYRETDFDFASRLMEEEGIYYFFEHEGGKHKMVIANTPQSHPLCPSKSDIPFSLKVPEAEDYVTSISKWQNNHRLQSGKVSFWDYHFQVPNNKLETTQPSLYKVSGNDNLEVYDHPGHYAVKYDNVDRGGGERTDVPNVFDDKTKKAEIVMQSLDAQYRVVTGTSDCSSMTAGYRFNLFNHPNDDQNAPYVLTSVTLEVEQNPTYTSRSFDVDIEQPYINSFTCIAYGKGSPPFRPVRKTNKPFVQGSQTAMVVGPSGEEIFTDKFGRVKVQFHWDRHNQYNSDSSCWVRVAQAWAGNRWGMMFLPRIGMEVIVDFLEGNPDNPIITGCVYNEKAMPPYKLPDEKTKMTIKSNSSIGGGGFNEIRFEDKKGSEQIFIHAQKDQDTRVENDVKETILHDRHLHLAHDQYEKVLNDKHQMVEGNKTEAIRGALSLKVETSIQEKAGTKYALDAGQEIHLKSGVNLTVETGASLTLKVGGNFININPAGIFIKGTMVMINSGGAAGSGSGSNPDSPTPPKEISKTDAGIATAKNPPPPPLNPKNLMEFAMANYRMIMAIIEAQAAAKALVAAIPRKKVDGDSSAADRQAYNKGWQDGVKKKDPAPPNPEDSHNKAVYDAGYTKGMRYKEKHGL